MKKLNLITDRWLPVRRLNGEAETVSLSDLLSDRGGGPVAEIDAARPDFRLYCMEFLIGLANYLYPPESEEEWVKLLLDPPSEADFKSRLEPLIPYFDLYGNENKTNFFQEQGNLTAEEVSAAKLLVEDRGGWFSKTLPAEKICAGCAAMALISFNYVGRAGGNGYMTGVRGGGPLSTLLEFKIEGLESTLWRKLYANVLPAKTLGALNQNGRPTSVESVFPWAAPLRTSEKKTQVAPSDVSPFHVFFTMPNRFQLLPLEDGRGTCDLCGNEDVPLITRVKRRNKGPSYTETWRHPFTPYQQLKDDQLIPLKGKRGGVTYRDWPSFVFENAATVIENAHRYQDLFEDIDSDERPPKAETSFHCFGYDADNAKVRCWYSKKMPVLRLPEDKKEAMQAYVRILNELTLEVILYLRLALRNVRTEAPKSPVKDWREVEMEFVEETEKDFFRVVSDLFRSESAPGRAFAEDWRRKLSETALNVFRRRVVDVDPENARWDRIHKRMRILAGSCWKGKKIEKILNQLGE